MIYIDNGNTVKEYYTDKIIEKSIMNLLETNKDLCYSETIDGCCVEIVDKEADNCPIKAEIPDNATKGDVVKATFPDFEYIEREYLVIVKDGYYEREFPMSWWNAPYKAESEDKE